MMKFIMAIDDTDNQTSQTTGELLSHLMNELQDKFTIDYEPISRHQLPLIDEIDYTRESRAFATEIIVAPAQWNDFYDYTKNYIRDNAEQEANPGLCFVNLEDLSTVNAVDFFGRRAKTAYVSKEEAQAIADKYSDYIFLDQLGGDGTGIIGALAASGLRIYGYDGKYQDQVDLEANASMTVQEIITNSVVEEVIDEDAVRLSPDEEVILPEVTYAIRWKRKISLIAEKQDDGKYHIKKRKDLLEEEIGG